VSDEIDTGAKVVGLGGGIAGVVAVLWTAFLRRAGRNEDKVEADRDERISKLEAKCEALAERMNSALSAQRSDIGTVREMAIRTEERLAMREGRRGEPVTGMKQLTPEQRRLLQQIDEESAK
jgi:hypothetical protein